MALLRWQQNITDDAGNVLAGAQVEIRDEGTGALVNLFEDIDGLTSKGNPLTTDSSGYAFAYMSPGRFKITATSGSFSFSWRDVRLANDFSDLDGRINSRVIRLNDMTSFQDVATADLVDGYQFSLIGYDPGSDKGGGPFCFDSGRSKDDHDGALVVSATVPWDGLQATKDDFRDGVGETDPGGTGVFVRKGGDTGTLYRISNFGGVSDVTVTDNSGAIQDCLDAAVSSGSKVAFWDGQYGYSSTVVIPKSIVVVGYGAPAEGSTLSTSAIIWTGGADPMMTMAETRIRFFGLSVRNAGSATCWIEQNAGAQSLFLDRIYCTRSTDNAFTRAVIACNGNTMGYSRLTRLYITSPAPVFIDIDGQGTGNNITPFYIGENSIFDNTFGDFTVVKLKDEGVECLDIFQSTFNRKNGNEMCLVDTTDTPVAEAIKSLNIWGNEYSGASNLQAGHRALKLTNVLACNLNGNQITGSSLEFFATLVNSNVTSCHGNTISNIVDAFFDADDNSKIVHGANSVDNNGAPMFLNELSGYGRVDFSGTVILIRHDRASQEKTEIFVVDIPDATAYSWRLDVNTPYTPSPGQVFNVIARNNSGGAVADINFANNFISNGPYTAPANGNEKSFTFYFDGTNGKLINEGPEVSIV